MRVSLFLVLIILSNTILAQNNYQSLNFKNSSSKNFQLLDNIPQSTKLIIAGEDHRYRKVNAKIEIKLLTYLHKKHGVKNLIFEFGEAMSYLVNEYVYEMDTNQREILSYYFDDVYVNFFDSLKQYNATLNKNERIKTYGIDVLRSYQIGFEALNQQIPDKIVAHDSIQLYLEMVRIVNKSIIDNIKKLNEYRNPPKKKNNIDYSQNYYRGDYFNNSESFKLINQNFERHKSLYKEYLGDKYKVFESTINQLKITNNYYKKSNDYYYNNKNTPYSNLLRENYIFQNLNRIVTNNPNEKFFAQFGRAHTISYKSVEAENNAFYPFITKIQNDSNNLLYDKVVSIGLFYSSSPEANYDVDPFNVDFEDITPVFKNVNALLKSDYTLIQVDEGSELDSLVHQNYPYIIVYNNKIEEEYDYYTPYYREYELSNFFSFTYGIQDYDLSSVNNLIGLDLDNQLRTIGLGFATYETNGFYFGFGFDYTLPQRISNKGFNYRINGYNIHMNWGRNFSPFNGFHLIPMLGIGYKQQKLTYEELGIGIDQLELQELSFKNPAFIFNGAIEMRYHLSYNFGLVVRGGYHWDISRESWKQAGHNVDLKSEISSPYISFGIILGDEY